MSSLNSAISHNYLGNLAVHSTQGRQSFGFIHTRAHNLLDRTTSQYLAANIFCERTMDIKWNLCSVKIQMKSYHIIDRRSRIHQPLLTVLRTFQVSIINIIRTKLGFQDVLDCSVVNTAGNSLSAHTHTH